jgi:hypothetical protein
LNLAIRSLVALALWKLVRHISSFVKLLKFRHHACRDEAFTTLVPASFPSSLDVDGDLRQLLVMNMSL